VIAVAEPADWTETVAGRFHSAAGNFGFPSREEFARAAAEEERMAARRVRDEGRVRTVTGRGIYVTPRD
jgi:hypothetical protein